MLEEIALVLVGGVITTLIYVMLGAFGWKGKITALAKDTDFLDKHLDRIDRTLDEIKKKHVEEDMCAQRVKTVCKKIEGIRSQIKGLTILVASMYEGNGHGDPKDMLEKSSVEDVGEEILDNLE